MLRFQQGIGPLILNFGLSEIGLPFTKNLKVETGSMEIAALSGLLGLGWVVSN